jgi:hypothetical protein
LGVKREAINLDELVKSRNSIKFVIPAKAEIKLKLATEGTEITEFLKPKKYKDKCQVSKAIRLRRTKVEKRNFLYNPVISRCSGPRLSPG